MIEQQKIDIAEESSTTTTTTTSAEAATKATINTTSQRIMIFSKMLVAIDGSDASMDAADYAIFISKEYNTELLYALHVIQPAELDLSFGQIKEEIPPSSYYVVANTNNNNKEEAYKYLDKVKLLANEKKCSDKNRSYCFYKCSRRYSRLC